MFPHNVNTDSSSRRRCLASWWWSGERAGDAELCGAEGTWSWSPANKMNTEGKNWLRSSTRFILRNRNTRSLQDNYGANVTREQCSQTTFSRHETHGNPVRTDTWQWWARTSRHHHLKPRRVGKDGGFENLRVRVNGIELTWNCLIAGLRHLLAAISWTFMIWMAWARARWRAPMSRS